MAQPPKPGAFLSYKTDDGSQFADKLEDALTKRGITVWRDKNSMQPGDDLFDEIADGIDNCSVFIALITPGYVITNLVIHYGLLYSCKIWQELYLVEWVLTSCK